MKYRRRINLLKSQLCKEEYDIVQKKIDDLNKVNVSNILDFSTTYILVNNNNDNEKDVALSLCVYKNYLFLGIYDDNTKRLTFNDVKHDLLELDVDDIDQLSYRLENLIKNKAINIDNIRNAWINTQPLLNKVIELKKTI